MNYKMSLNHAVKNYFHCTKCLYRRSGNYFLKKSFWKTEDAPIRLRMSTCVPRDKEWIRPSGYKTGIHIYNSLTKRKDELILPKENYLNWYICGPTVYDKSHIGHASNFVRYDIIRRILDRFFNINITYLMGVTDVDDKIINRARELDQEFTVLTNHYEREFFQEMLALNILQPTITSRVTDFIPEIVKFIQKIFDRGHAYKAEDGSVYFDVKAYGNYNRFIQARDLSKTNPGVKRSPEDFVLWKAAKVGEPCWPSPWGPGRPGWHIECSAMASRVFGSNIDIHSGGQDLMFPHHENELAQSCSYHDCGQWANYWMHTGFLHLQFDAEKMSKSLKNVIPTSHILEKYTANQFRMFCMITHYRNNIEFTDEKMRRAIILDNQIGHFLRQCDAYIRGQFVGGDISEAEVLNKLKENEERIIGYFKDDFRTPEAMKVLFEFIKSMTAIFSKNDAVCRSPGAVAATSTHIKRLCKKLGFHKKGWKHVVYTEKYQMSQEPDNMKLKEVLDNTVKFRWNVRQFALQPPLQHPETMSAKQKKEENQRVFGPLLKHCDDLRSQLGTCKINLSDHKTYSSWEFDDTGNKTDDSNWEETDSEMVLEDGEDISHSLTSDNTPTEPIKSNETKSPGST